MNQLPRSGFPQISPQLGQAAQPLSGALPPPTPLRAVPPGQLSQIVAAPVDAAAYTIDREPQLRVSFYTRAGQHWSYPYSYLGLIEMPSPDYLAIHCNSREVALIEVKGRQLGEIAKYLAAQKLVSIAETDHTRFTRGGVCVSSIAVNRAPNEC